MHFECGMRNVACGDVEACLIMTPLKITWLKCESSIHHKRKLKFRDGSLFVGMTGSDKKWPGHEKFRPRKKKKNSFTDNNIDTSLLQSINPAQYTCTTATYTKQTF